MASLTVLQWVTLIAAALFIGLSKTAFPGSATLSVVMFAAVIPARASTAMMLLLLLTGDLIAIWTYRRDADWHTLRKLLPTVVVGVVVGAIFLNFTSDLVMKRSIGWIVLVLTAITLFNMRASKRADKPGVGDSAGASRVKTDAEVSDERTQNVFARTFYGMLGGFTTMAANAGGPVMTLYFLWSRFPVKRFLGTTAWFFFLINVVKLPFSIGIGLITPAILPVDAALAIFVIIGALFGRWVIRYIKQSVFDPIVITLTVISSIYLVL
ncbi:sulfite exporter TauE/SafE family protein [Gleimia hominis]|uniref:Probable membrane transporter protein n=1 Tax=Gleimia hominis TaxID=595468 RepID=A0ABU3I9W7_9ACTO|nr:sulfite exporter TauE/SafE family protein [Gleimia hominis]MDT3766731.1 sulfite exporter TauE/SafE family protein [Gleimia hominis]